MLLSKIGSRPRTQLVQGMGPGAWYITINIINTVFVFLSSCWHQ